MAENLNYEAEGSVCYDNEPANCDKYGRLYNWNTAKSACPKGWHLPSRDEWKILTITVGGEKTAGKLLKAKSGWNKNGNGLDFSGFFALPSGYGSSDGHFYHIGNYGHWWRSDERGSYYAYYQGMGYDYEDAYWDHESKNYLFSVRCLQD